VKTALIGCIAAALATTGADAGFAGFVAFSRNVGANTVIDVFVATTNASDKFLNVYDLSSNGTFVQRAGFATKTWKPDTAGFTNTRNTSDDSFMTAGTFSGGAYGGEYYASTNTNGDPNFTGTSWSGPPASPAATTFPSNAGWYTGDPTSVDNNAELMSTWAGSFTRANSLFISGFNAGAGATAAATHGIWCAHLVVAGNNKDIGVDFTFAASASIKDGVTGATTQGRYQLIPAPSALALLSLSGLASRRRRS
jgi:MYXO-CTERM domain-containing protein